MVAIGSLAGFAAQNAALTQAAERSAAGQTVSSDELALVITTSGDRFFSGSLVDGLLLEGGPYSPVSALVAASAVTQGAEPAELPDCGEIASHVAGSIGGAGFGVVRAPSEDTPKLQPVECLTLLWSGFEELMRLPAPAHLQAPNEPPLHEACWPVIAAMAADQFIERAKDVLAPSVSAGLVIEAAVIASKIDPEQITPGRWALEANLQVVRVIRP